MENLSILLKSDPEGIASDDLLVFPSQQEILDRIILKKRNIVETEKCSTYKTGFIFKQPVALIWDDEYDQRRWS